MPSVSITKVSISRIIDGGNVATRRSIHRLSKARIWSHIATVSRSRPPVPPGSKSWLGNWTPKRCSKRYNHNRTTHSIDLVGLEDENRAPAALFCPLPRIEIANMYIASPEHGHCHWLSPASRTSCSAYSSRPMLARRTSSSAAPERSYSSRNLTGSAFNLFNRALISC